MSGVLPLLPYMPSWRWHGKMFWYSERTFSLPAGSRANHK